jgi:hypothetical protein
MPSEIAISVGTNLKLCRIASQWLRRFSFHSGLLNV